MQNFMGRYFKAGATVCGTLLFFLLLSSCVKIDDSVGKDFIPHNQYMKIAIDSSFYIKTYNVTVDSVFSSGQVNNYFGSYLDAVTGSINAGLLFQMSPPYLHKDSMGYGKNAVIDSAFFHFSVNNILGKKDVDQTFEIFELKERILYYKSYYSNFDPDPIREDVPLLTFTHSGEDDVIKAEVNDAAFFAKLLDTTGFWRDTVMHQRFKGFYIRPKDAHKDAAIYRINNTTSFLQIYYHNETTKPDTSFQTAAYFEPPYDSQGYFLSYNQIINVVDHDYTHADPGLRLDDEMAPAAKTYIQGYAGIHTCLEFTDESIAALKKKVKDAGYLDVAVNKARLQVFFPARTYEDLEKTYGRLGMYINYDELEGIPDHTYYAEVNGYSSYGGYINRSRYLYEMDITRYVQRLFQEDYDKKRVHLAPCVFGSTDYTYQINPMALYGYGSVEPLRLILTYTMIR